jgi:hypothetical protein
MKNNILSIKSFIFIIIKLIYLKLLIIISSPLIGLKKNLQIISQEFKYEISTIQKKPWSIIKINFGEFNFSDKSIGDIYLNNFRIYFVNFQINRLSFINDLDNNLILSDDNNEGNLQIIYDFNFKIPQLSSKLRSGKFLLQTSSIKIIKKYFIDKDDENNIKEKVSLNLKLSIPEDEIKFETKLDEIYLKNISFALNDFLVKGLYNTFYDNFNSDIQYFYNKKNEKNLIGENSKINLIGFSPDVNFEIDLKNENLSEIKIDNNGNKNIMIYTKSGKLNNANYNNTENEIFFSYAISGEENYSEIFLSRKIIENMINMMTEKGLFDFSVNENNINEKSPFDLNIDYLSNVIPEITNSFSPSRRISIYNNASNIIFDNSTNFTDKFIIISDIETTIFEKIYDTVIFKIKSKITLTLKPFISLCFINFYFDKITLIDVKILSGDFNFVNMPILYGYIKDYYNLYFEKVDKFYLLKSPLDLSKTCENINKYMFTEKGFNFIFTPKIFSGLEKQISKYNIVKDSDFEILKNKALKFLNSNI